MGISSGAAVLEAEEQTAQLAGAIGANNPVDACQEIFRIAQTLQPMPDYLKYRNTRFVWEMLDMGTDTEVLRLVKLIVWNWIEVTDIDFHCYANVL